MMEAEETPLEVLSRVASMVENFDSLEDFKGDSKNIVTNAEKTVSGYDGGHFSTKELCTKWKKEQRWRDKPFHPVRLNCKKCTSSKPSSVSTAHTPPALVESDHPLDMTITAASQWHKELGEDVHNRPSVITCVTSSPNCGTTEILTQSSDQLVSDEGKELASYDPVIDEHFRRSLGKDYQNLFSSSDVTSTFAGTSALGPTWIRLQESQKGNEINARKSSSETLQSPNSSHISSRNNLVLT